MRPSLISEMKRELLDDEAQLVLNCGHRVLGWKGSTVGSLQTCGACPREKNREFRVSRIVELDFNPACPR
jgi:hypothetical protein